MAKSKTRQRHQIAKSIPKTAEHKIVKQEFIQASFMSGPLPPPEIMRGYNEILPGAAERIVAVFESEVAHRHDLERQQMNCPIQA